MTGAMRTWWRRPSLRQRLLLAVSLPFVAIVLLTSATFILRQYALETREASVEALENEVILTELLNAGHRAHTGAAMHAQTGTDSWRRSHDRAAAQRRALLISASDRLPTASYDVVARAVRRHDRALRPLLAVPDSPSERRGLLARAAARELSLQRTVAQVSTAEQVQHERTRAQADRLNFTISAAGVLIGLLGVVGGVAAVSFVSRQIVDRLRRVQASAERLKTGRHLVDETEARDEIGALARAIASAGSTIREQDDLLDLALEVGSMVIFEVRPDGDVTLRGEPALLELAGIRGRSATLPLVELESRLESSTDVDIERLPDGGLAVRTPTGETRWLQVRSRTQPLGNGRQHPGASTVVGVVADVTTQIRTHDALADAKDAAVQANRAKDEFLSRMSHELRTPLNAVLGFAQLLEMDELDGQQRESVTHILKGGRHLLALVNDVLDLARIESGRLSLSVEPTRLTEVVEEALTLTEPLARQHQVTLVGAGGGSERVHAMVDRRRTRQVLINLLSNGIKYNRPGGSVEVSWTLVGEHVRLAVRDTGIGVDERQVADLFLPFARSDTRTAEIEGSGLGLAVSRSLVEAMGGSLTLAETGPGGSTFLVELPEAAYAAVEPGAAVPCSALDRLRALGPLSVLHVEDNSANQRLVEELLRRAGSPTVVSAETGAAGLDLARQHRPDVVLLDRHLPDMLGEDVLRALRADDLTAAVPVVVVTADALERSRELLRRSGADAFVSKPVDAEEFWETLSSVLAHRGVIS